jgi:hypothetical protein
MTLSGNTKPSTEDLKASDDTDIIPVSEDTKVKPSYVLVCVPIGEAPGVRCVTGKQELVKAVREIYTANDQQYLYVIKGKKGEVSKSKTGLTVSFGEEQEITIPVHKISKTTTGGWLGD